jgi:hypothetical protein
VRTGRFSVGRGGILLPMSDDAKNMVANVGEVLDVEAIFDRDMIFHRRLFATVRDLADAVGQSDRWMRAQLLVYTGLFDVVGTLDHKHVVAVRSMSRRAMKNDELHNFWDKAKQPIAERILPLVTNENTREQLLTAVTAF